MKKERWRCQTVGRFVFRSSHGGRVAATAGGLVVAPLAGVPPPGPPTVGNGPASAFVPAGHRCCHRRRCGGYDHDSGSNPPSLPATASMRLGRCTRFGDCRRIHWSCAGVAVAPWRVRLGGFLLRRHLGGEGCAAQQRWRRRHHHHHRRDSTQPGKPRSTRDTVMGFGTVRHPLLVVPRE